MTTTTNCAASATITNSTTTADASPDILALALEIVSRAANLKALLASEKLPAPDFSADSPELPDTPEHAALRSGLVAALDDLRLLVVGPRTTMRALMGASNDLAALQVAFEFSFFSIVPVAYPAGIAVEEVARQAGIDVGRTRQVMRYLCTHRIFREVKDDWFAHTAISAPFGRDENLVGLGQYSMDDMFKSASATADCIKASPRVSDLVHSPFTTRLGETMFDFYDNNPVHAARFARAMAGVTTIDRKPNTLSDIFPWDSLKGTVVDVGGGTGHVSRALAQRFPHLSFRVQDSEKMLAEGRRVLATEDPAVASRIQLQEHDFFKPQPPAAAEGTDGPVAAFFLRHIFHNWADADSIAILRTLVPSLETAAAGTPILISDRVLPRLGDGTPLHEERAMRRQDIMMLVGLGAKERTRAEWEALFREADERLELKTVHGQGQSALLEVVLKK